MFTTFVATLSVALALADGALAWNKSTTAEATGNG